MLSFRRWRARLLKHFKRSRLQRLHQTRDVWTLPAWRQKSSKGGTHCEILRTWKSLGHQRVQRRKTCHSAVMTNWSTVAWATFGLRKYRNPVLPLIPAMNCKCRSLWRATGPPWHRKPVRTLGTAGTPASSRLLGGIFPSSPMWTKPTVAKLLFLIKLAERESPTLPSFTPFSLPSVHTKRELRVACKTENCYTLICWVYYKYLKDKMEQSKSCTMCI